MPHVPPTTIHTYQKRAIDVTVDVDTDLEPEDLTSIVFQFLTVEKTGLTAVSGGSGLTIDLTLTATDVDVDVATYRYECRATIAGETRTLAAGRLRVDPEPTTPS